MNSNPRLTLPLALSATSPGAGIWGALPATTQAAKPQPLTAQPAPPAPSMPPADVVEMSQKEVQRRETARPRAVEQPKLPRNRMATKA